MEKKTLYQKLTFNRVARIRATLQTHIEYGKREFGKTAAGVVSDYDSQLHTLNRKVQTLSFTKALILTLLYASFVGVYFQNTVLEEAFSLATMASGVIGSTLLLLLFAGVTRLSNVYVSDAHTLASLVASFIESEKRALEVTRKVKKIVKKNS